MAKNNVSDKVVARLARFEPPSAASPAQWNEAPDLVAKLDAATLSAAPIPANATAQRAPAPAAVPGAVSLPPPTAIDAVLPVAWKLPDLLHCASCTQSFSLDIKGRRSVLLPRCGHALCEGCAERAAAGGGNVLCMVCKTRHTKEDLQSLAASTVAQHPVVVDLLLSSDGQARPCDECSAERLDAHLSERRAVARCVDCDKQLCQLHATVHKKMRASREHKVEHVLPVFPPAECRMHRQSAEMLCATCNALVCLQCIGSSTNHPARTHVVTLLDAAAAKALCSRAAAVRANAAEALDVHIATIKQSEVDLETLNHGRTELEASVARTLEALGSPSDARRQAMRAELLAVPAGWQRQARLALANARFELRRVVYDLDLYEATVKIVQKSENPSPTLLLVLHNMEERLARAALAAWATGRGQRVQQ